MYPSWDHGTREVCVFREEGEQHNEAQLKPIVIAGVWLEKPFNLHLSAVRPISVVYLF